MHSFPLTGTVFEWKPVEQIASSFRIDTFFAITGFLVLRSWDRRPDVRGFVRARMFRILPAFWANLIITALVIVPAALWLAGKPMGVVFTGSPNVISYIVDNAATWMFHFDIAGTPTGVPYPGVWNGSLWMVSWEMICYLGLLAIGVLGLVRRRIIVLAATGLMWAAVALDSIHLLPGGWWVETFAGFGLVMLCGACLYLFRDKVPFSQGAATVSAGALALSPLLPDYRLLGGPALAYLAFWVSLKVAGNWTRPKADLSFGIFLYGFPVQQTIMLCGFPFMHPLALFAVALPLTVPFAAFSWYCIERPASRLRRRLDARAGK